MLRKTASRTDETAPGLKKNKLFNVFFALYVVTARFTAASGRHSEDHEFLWRHGRFIAETEYSGSPKAARTDNGFSGVGHRVSVAPVALSMDWCWYPLRSTELADVNE